MGHNSSQLHHYHHHRKDGSGDGWGVKEESNGHADGHHHSHKPKPHHLHDNSNHSSPSTRRHSTPNSLYRDRAKDRDRDLGVSKSVTSGHGKGHGHHASGGPAPGHVVSWSAGGPGCKGHSNFFTNDADDFLADDKTHAPLSRLYPRSGSRRGGGASSLHSSPSTSPSSKHKQPSRGDGSSDVDYDMLTSSDYLPSWPTGLGTLRGEGEGKDVVVVYVDGPSGGEGGKGRGGEARRSSRSPSPSTSPKFDSVRSARARSASPSSPSPTSSHHKNQNHHNNHNGRQRPSSSRSPSPSPVPSPAHSPSAARAHPIPARRRTSPAKHVVKLCTYGPHAEEIAAEESAREAKARASFLTVPDAADFLRAPGDGDDDDDSDDFPWLNDQFRPRSVSDASVHVGRRRMLRRGRREAEEEDAEHAHVHWADEKRGSPLATSVLLTAVRPRALSHGSATLPTKTILKKHP